MSRSQRPPAKGPFVEVNISTWTKDSHGLYDYEAQEEAYRKETQYIKNSCKIYRDHHKSDTIIDTTNKHGENNNNSLVAEVIIDKTKNSPEFKLKCNFKKQTPSTPEHPHHHRTPYLVVRQSSKNKPPKDAPPVVNNNNSPPPNGYPLKPGNIIKLGRVQYMVIESKNQLKTETIRNTNHFDEANGVFEIEKHLKERDDAIQEGENTCKVCLCSEETESDPLISPCNCKGSCRLIHVGCLKTWINSKVKKEIKGIVQSYNFTKFECEICKFPFPQIVRFQDKDMEMMTISKPNKPYILFESIGNKHENRDERWLHLVSSEENSSIKIGRGHDCQIRITDISVSRKHAEIVLRDGDFYIADTKAKFGTLIRLDQDFTLTPNKAIRIQFARTVFEFKIRSADQAEEVDTQ